MGQSCVAPDADPLEILILSLSGWTSSYKLKHLLCLHFARMPAPACTLPQVINAAYFSPITGEALGSWLGSLLKTCCLGCVPGSSPYAMPLPVGS